MGLFLFRFWPALIPLVLYVLWFIVVRHKAVMEGKTPPRFRDGPVYWTIIATLLVGAGCFIVLGSMQPGVKGEYIPPHMENGTLIPGRVRAGE